MNSNVKPLGCLVQLNYLNGLCISQILSPDSGYSPMSYDECTQAKENGEIDIGICYNGNDYFAGAIKACGGKKSNLPTIAQLKTLASYLYDGATICSGGGCTTYAQLNTKKAAPFWAKSTSNNSFSIWSNYENSSTTGAYYRIYYNDKTFEQANYKINGTGRTLKLMTVCLDKNY